MVFLHNISKFNYLNNIDHDKNHDLVSKDSRKHRNISKSNVAVVLKICKLIISCEFINLKISIYKKIKQNQIDILSKKLEDKEKKIKGLKKFGKHFFKIAANKPKDEITQAEIDRYSMIKGQNLAKLKKNVASGMCQGACIEFAKKFHDLKKIGPVNEKNLKKLAKEFKSGVAVAGVVHHLAYINGIHEKNFFSVQSNIKKHRGSIQPPQCSQIFVENVSLKQQTQNIDEKKISTVCIDDWNFFTSNKKNVLNAITSQLGLEYLSIGKEISPDIEDAAYLENIKDFREGTYNVTFKMGSMRHAILLLKVEGRMYIWDPNEGLLKCNKKDPAKTVLAFLSTYEPPNKSHKKSYGFLFSENNRLLHITEVKQKHN